MEPSTFRTYVLAVQFYKETRELRLSRHLKEQFDRAASSIALNLHEGSAKSNRKERVRYFEIALGSIRECQAIFELESVGGTTLDALAASAHKLCAALRN